MILVRASNRSAIVGMEILQWYWLRSMRYDWTKDIALALHQAQFSRLHHC